MKAFPISYDGQAAIGPDMPVAATQARAEQLSGAKIRLACEELRPCFATPEDAEAALPGLYGDPRFELIWREGGYRVVVRFWQPIPAAPVAKGVRLAAKAPIGTARTEAEAEALLHRSAELIEAPIGDYVSEARAMQARAKLAAPLAARIEQSGARWRLLLSYWRPDPRKFGAADREVLASRARSPLRARAPQASPFVGLFESLAPENPAVILAEEGDGRAEAT